MKQKSFLTQAFDIKDLGPMDMILGVNVNKRNNEFTLTQYDYIEKKIRKN